MSHDISDYSLRSGVFTTCSGTWDAKLDRFRNTTATERVKCCLEQCMEPVNFCVKYCETNAGPGKVYDDQKKLDVCLNTCQTYRKLCSDICETSSPYFTRDSEYLDCANQKGCLQEGTTATNAKCIKKHEDELLACCLDHCIPASDLDCNKYCNFAHQLALGGGKDALMSQKPDNGGTWVPIRQNDYTLVVLTCGTILGLFFLFIFTRKNMKLRSSTKF